MARCRLDISHPKFRALVGDDADLQAGLEELRGKVAKDRALSNFFIQPMPRFPDYQNKIWKWDFAPEGLKSSTRKGWRLFAYVPDPKASEPIPATSFFVYARSESPGGNPAKELAKALRKFLADTATPADDQRFRRQTENENIRSLCLACYETVIVSSVISEVDAAELNHQCS